MQTKLPTGLSACLSVCVFRWQWVCLCRPCPLMSVMSCYVPLSHVVDMSKSFSWLRLLLMTSLNFTRCYCMQYRHCLRQLNMSSCCYPGTWS